MEKSSVDGKSSFQNIALNKLNSLPLLGVILFIFSTSFPPLDLLTQINLPIHMGQHALIALSGALIAYPFYVKRKARGKMPPANYAISTIFIIAIIIIFWHLPLFWDAAVLNPLIHALEHVSFLIVGLLIGFFFPALPDNVKFMSVFLAASGHMVYGIYLFIMPTAVYPLYPVSQQDILAIFMLFPSPAYFIALLVIPLYRQTKRLEMIEFASKGITVANPSRDHKHGDSALSALRKRIVPILSVFLIVVFLGYLVVTVGMIYFPSASAQIAIHGSDAPSTVYIVETPVTWNYLPQNIVVVIGVNNTVVWTSHSLSEDTVTSSTGLFDSGIIHPGQSWSYTFNTPGTYHYYCDFHPWMQGTVRVLGSNS